MNRKTIQKVIDELNKPQPRLDYVKGILETIIESLPGEVTVTSTHPEFLTNAYTTSPSIAVTDDEGTMLDAEARSKLAKVQALAQESNG